SPRWQTLSTLQRPAARQPGRRPGNGLLSAMPAMKRPVLGITGGIASGKSSVLSMLSQRGIPTVSSDRLAHAAIRKGRPAYRGVLRAFGREILDKKGEIDRRRLGRVVFADPKARKRLERIVHPWVTKALRR